MDSPESLNVQTGEPVALEVIISGSPDLKTRWFKGNNELSADAKYQISDTKKVTTLKIQSAEKADAGEYTLEVSNHVGTATCTMNLAVSGWWLVYRLSNHLRTLCGSRNILRKQENAVNNAYVYFIVKHMIKQKLNDT